jgi:hypothetical protein
MRRIAVVTCWMPVLFAALAPAVAGAQDAIKLQGLSDVYFQWRPMPKGSAMCGYAVLGNHTSHDNPKIEWDIFVDEIVQGSDRLVAVSVGTFNVSGKARTPRAPITQLSFTVADDPQPIPAQLVGKPNADNAVRATLDTGRASNLFYAFSNEHEIAANLTYADGRSEQVKFAGFRDSRKFGRGKNSPFDQCLRGETPNINWTHPVT